MAQQFFKVAGLAQHQFGPHGALFMRRDQVRDWSLVVDKHNPYASDARGGIAVFGWFGPLPYKIGYVPNSRLKAAHDQDWVNRPCSLFQMNGDSLTIQVALAPPK